MPETDGEPAPAPGLDAARVECLAGLSQEERAVATGPGTFA